MTSKFSWISFIPLAVAAVFFKFVNLMYVDSGSSAVFGLSPLWCEYISLFCIAGIFLLTILFCVLDRTISPYYAVRRNFGAAIFGLLLAALFAYDGCTRIFEMVQTGRYEVLPLIEIAFTILAAVSFVVLGLSHFTRKTSGRYSLLFLLPALMCAVRLVSIFITFTTISVTTADVSLLIAYIFSTLFLFNYAVMLSLTEAKNAVKWCFIYGFPAVAALFAYGISNIYFNFNYDEIFANVGLFEIVLLGVYIFSFMVELTAFSKPRDMVVIKDGDEDEEEYTEIDPEKEKELPPIITGLDEEDEIPDDKQSMYLTTADTSDYIYQETPVSDELNGDLGYIDANASVVDDYITEKNDEYDVTAEKTVDDDTYNSRLDEIDKLILEISEDEFQ